MAFIQMDFFSQYVMKTVHVQLILPWGESDGNVEPPFKTLYFLPGFSNAANDVMLTISLKSLVLSHGIAIVTLDGDNSFYVDHCPMSEYSRLIGEELLPLTRKLFPLSKKREDTFIGGMSMGGYGALYNGLRYSESFEKIALLAPGLDFYNIRVPGTELKMFSSEFLNRCFGSENKFSTTDFNYRVAFDQAEEKGLDIPEIFHSCGDNDPLVGADNKDFGEFLQRKGYSVKYCTVPGGHDEEFLNNVMPYFLNFLIETGK